MSNQAAIYLSHPYPCDYLPNRYAQSLYLPPDTEIDVGRYTTLVANGFRRSGRLIYRPHCPGCRACVPVRIPVARFRPNRSQRRCWRKNRDLTVIDRPAAFHREHYELYRRYIDARHGDGGMADSSPEDYADFLFCDWCDTHFYEFRRQDTLLAVAVVDVLEDGLSAVYTFFDPNQSERGLGTYAILWEIAAARRMNLRWLYLGYWIAQCGKMAYKNRFQPLEYFRGERWHDHLPP